VRPLTIAIFLTLIISSTPVADRLPTLTFEDHLLRADAAGMTFEYGDFSPCAVGIGPSVSAAACLVMLTGDETAADLSWSVPSRRSLGRLDDSTALVDRMTALDPDRSAAIRSGAPNAPPGSQPVLAGPEIERDGLRYLRLTVFPVTIDRDGQVWFNRSLNLRLGQRQLSAADIVYATSPATRENTLSQATDGIGPDYLIVTGNDLAEAAQRLAAYKTATGYTAEVRLIADITAAFAGRDDAERLRECLKDFYSEGGRYVLLAGDETVLPVRYAYHSSSSIPVPVEQLQLCDLYFADLTGEWDADNDDIWGERIGDAADLIPELAIGRLPFHTASQLNDYIDKLIVYETNPGNGDASYVNRAFFFSSDEMRDYGGDGQHARIAAAYPNQFDIDSTAGVEATTGDDPSPTNAAARDLPEVLSEGYGIVNILAHGRPDAFAVRTAAYNQSPKSYFTTGDTYDDHGSLDSLAQNNRVGLYYSLACDNGGFDEDRPPFVYTNDNLVARLLAQPAAGAVGFVAYSRWGWVGSSHLLQKAFFDTLFAHPDRPAVDAMNAAKRVYYYYRDLVLGQNFYGDPTLRVYTDVPAKLNVSLAPELSGVMARVHTDTGPTAACTVIVSGRSGRVEQAATDADGYALLRYDFALGEQYTIAAISSGCTIGLTTYAPSIATDVNEDDAALPDEFALAQNYPNPFNPTTTIEFDLPRAMTVDLSIYNATGRRVVTLASGLLSVGTHRVEWNGRSQSGRSTASGVYYYRLSGDGYTATRKMVLLK